MQSWNSCKNFNSSWDCNNYCGGNVSSCINI